MRQVKKKLIGPGVALALVLSVGLIVVRSQSGAGEQLIVAAEAGDLPTVKRLLLDGAPINHVRSRLIGLAGGEPTRENETALFVAAREGHENVVRLLLSAGADPEIRCTEGGTALTIAASRRYTGQVVPILLAAGVDAIGPKPNGRSALEWAIGYGSTEDVRALLLAQRDQLSTQSRQQLSVHLIYRNDWEKHPIRKQLSLPAELPQVERIMRDGTINELAEQLESSTADPDWTDDNGWSLLHWAAGRDGAPEKLQLVLERGANPNVATSEGFTPLMAAVDARSVGSVRLLLQAGADPDAVDSDERTALHIAAWHCGEDMIEVLLAAGADSELRNRWGRTAADCATLRRDRQNRGDVSSAFD